MNFINTILLETWHLLLDSGIYILFGLLIGGLLKVFLSPAYVASHLGKGRFSSVFKAALLGIPIPLCSCGVLPAAASLKKQGANNGATTAFLISTPESGVDSISITYALLDPIMTVARPIAAFISAFTAGITENLLNRPSRENTLTPDLSCTIDNCCSGIDCHPDDHFNHHTFREKLGAGLKFAGGELWGDLAGWFFIGLFLGGIITALVPNDILSAYLGGGLSSMLIMLAVGIPLYICATASTPIAAALILKGVSPGAALVFLLVGPATNMASLSVLTGMLGKKATARYLLTISVSAVLLGLILDSVYRGFDIVPQAFVGQAAEIIPWSLRVAGALIILALSIQPLYRDIRRIMTKVGAIQAAQKVESCGCSSCPPPSVSPFPMATTDNGNKKHPHKGCC